MKRKNGFTILEILIVGAVVSVGTILFFVQKANLDAMARDEDQKTAINAMYYALEEGFYAQNGYYPEYISEENLKMIDPALWTDPYGVNLGSEGSSYSYEAANCQNGKCSEYILKATLEKEDIYVKRNRN